MNYLNKIGLLYLIFYTLNFTVAGVIVKSWIEKFFLFFEKKCLTFDVFRYILFVCPLCFIFWTSLVCCGGFTWEWCKVLSAIPLVLVIHSFLIKK